MRLVGIWRLAQGHNLVVLVTHGFYNTNPRQEVGAWEGRSNV